MTGPLFAESRRGRRLVGRLERGVDLPTALVELCNARGIRSGELRAHGVLQRIELRLFDPRHHTWSPAQRFDTPSTIVQLSGTLSELEGRLHLEATCAVARQTDNGLQLLGGTLVSAQVYMVEFVVDSFDDLLLRRSMDQDTGLRIWTQVIAAPPSEPPARIEPVTAPRVGSTPPEATAYDDLRDEAVGPSPTSFFAAAPSLPLPQAGPALARPPSAPAAAAPSHGESWHEVIAASAERGEVQADAPEEPPLRAGDVIDHIKFGRCEVERVEGDTEFAQVRLRNGRLVRLSLDVLQIVRDGMEGNRRRFRTVLK